MSRYKGRRKLPKRGRTAIVLLVMGLVSMFAGAFVAASPADATGTTTVTDMPWAGNGSENADPGCLDGQSSYWHWILTPGGGNTLVSATLTVTYESGATSTSQGSFRGNGGGAMHFDVTQPGVDQVKSASVTYTYEGDGGNFVLTISDSSCNGEPNPPPGDSVPVPTQETVDACNPEGVTDNVAWKSALPADTDKVDWTESTDGRTRTATLKDQNDKWTDDTTAPKVFTLPADSGEKCETPPPSCVKDNPIYTGGPNGVSVEGAEPGTWLSLWDAQDAAHQTLLDKVQVGEDCSAVLAVPASECESHQYQGDLSSTEPPSTITDTTGDGVADIPGYIAGGLFTVPGNESKCEAPETQVPQVPVVDECGLGNAHYGDVPEGPYTVTRNDDGSITLTANEGTVFLGGLSEVTLPAPVDSGEVCPPPPPKDACPHMPGTQPPGTPCHPHIDHHGHHPPHHQVHGHQVTVTTPAPAAVPSTVEAGMSGTQPVATVSQSRSGELALLVGLMGLVLMGGGFLLRKQRN